jgi:hypothetical protein
MKLHYYPETDSLYIELKADVGAEVREVADGLNVDHASKRLDLSTLETISLPLTTTRAA